MERISNLAFCPRRRFRHWSACEQTRPLATENDGHYVNMPSTVSRVSGNGNDGIRIDKRVWPGSVSTRWKMAHSKSCPFCKEQNRQEAVKCRFCGEWLEPSTQPDSSSKLTTTEPERPSAEEEAANAELARIAEEERRYGGGQGNVYDQFDPPEIVFAEGATREERIYNFENQEPDRPTPNAIRFGPGEDVPYTFDHLPQTKEPDGSTIVYEPGFEQLVETLSVLFRSTTRIESCKWSA